MSDMPFEPFSPSMKAELKRQYEGRHERSEMLTKMLRAEMITKEEYEAQKKDLDNAMAKIEKIDREFGILS